MVMPQEKIESMTFAEHKEQTALDCEQVAKNLTELAGKVREGDMAAFEHFWFQGGTEDGDAKLYAIRETIFLRYAFRKERIRAKK